MRESTAPCKTGTRQIPSSTRRRSPSNSAPSILNPQRRPHRRRNSQKVDILKINHTEETDETTELPGSVTSPPKENNVVPQNSVIPKLQNSVGQNHHPPPNSKSDGDLLSVTKNIQMNNHNHVPNSYSETYIKKHNDQEQCCTSFTTTANGKPHFNANNCVLI